MTMTKTRRKWNTGEVYSDGNGGGGGGGVSNDELDDDKDAILREYNVPLSKGVW